jgi:serine/threonine protein kinase
VKVVDFPSFVAAFAEFNITADALEASLMREIEVMRLLRHRNIVRLEDSFWVGSELFMCMELVEGDNLLKAIPHGGLKEDDAKDFFFQLCSAVSYCHSNNVRAILSFAFSFLSFPFFLIWTSFFLLHLSTGHPWGLEAGEYFDSAKR